MFDAYVAICATQPLMSMRSTGSTRLEDSTARARQSRATLPPDDSPLAPVCSAT